MCRYEIFYVLKYFIERENISATYHGGATGWTEWAMDHPKIEEGGPQCIWPQCSSKLRWHHRGSSAQRKWPLFNILHKLVRRLSLRPTLRAPSLVALLRGISFGVPLNLSITGFGQPNVFDVAPLCYLFRIG